MVNLRLQPKQVSAFQSPATEILYGGAKYGGKSHLIRVAMIVWCADIPGLQCYLFRRISPDLWRNHMVGPGSFYALLAPWLKTGDVIYNSRGYWSFWNGSKIHLCHCQYDSDKYNYQGSEIHVLSIDQLEQWTQEMYEYIRAQVRLGGLQLPVEYHGRFPRILNSANPSGVGHNWVKSEFVSIAPKGQITQMPPERGGMKRQYIEALLEDNKIGIELDPTYEDRLKGMGSPALVKAMRYGIWDIVAGGALDDVWDEAVHVVPSFRIPLSWRVTRALDWGSSKPFSVGWWARTNGETVETLRGPWTPYPGSWVRVAEMYGWNGRPNEGCRMLAVEVARRILEIERFFHFPVLPGPADSAIFDSDVTIADDMLKIGVRWEPADKRPGSRAAGLEHLRKLLKAGLSHPMEEPGLFVFDTCQQFIRTVPVLQRDGTRVEDINTQSEDHVYDETRYAIMTPPREDRVDQVRL